MHSWWSTLLCRRMRKNGSGPRSTATWSASASRWHVLLTVHWHERSVATVLDRYKATLWRPEEKGELPSRCAS